VSVRVTLEHIWNANVPHWAWLLLLGIGINAVRYTIGRDQTGSPPDYTDDLTKDPSLGVRLGQGLSETGKPTFIIVAQECVCNSTILNPVLAEIEGRRPAIRTLRRCGSRCFERCLHKSIRS
jgi:hypothetical protein